MYHESSQWPTIQPQRDIKKSKTAGIFCVTLSHGWQRMRKDCLSDINIWTHWGRDNMSAISQTTFSNAFIWMKMYEFLLNLKFYWSLFLRTQLTISSIGSDNGSRRRPGDKPLSEPMMVSLLTHICVTRPRWVFIKPLTCGDQINLVQHSK